MTFIKAEIAKVRKPWIETIDRVQGELEALQGKFEAAQAELATRRRTRAELQALYRARVIEQALQAERGDAMLQ